MICLDCGKAFEQPSQERCPHCQAPCRPPMRPAGFWTRVGAMSIDTLIALAAGVLLALGGAPLTKRDLMANLAINACWLILGAAYVIVMTGLYGQTLGKMAVGIKVVKVDGSPVDMPVSAVRYLGTWLNNLTLGVGWLMVAFTEGKRGLHDRVAGTRVVVLPDNRTWLGVALGILTFLVPLVAGIAAALMLPRFAQLARPANENATKAYLRTLRSAAEIYHNTQGRYPAELAALPGYVKYMAAIPPAKVPSYHPDSNAVHPFSSLKDPRALDRGGWGYVNDPASNDFGNIFVNCTHTDTQGKGWDTY